MANYDVLESKESYLGTAIRSQIPNQLYKDNYDRIFGKKEKEERPLTDDDVDGKKE